MMDVGPLPEMPCWEELRAGCLMSSCEGDSDPGRPGVPRCYCEHQFWCSAFGKTRRDQATMPAMDWSVTSEVSLASIGGFRSWFDRQTAALVTGGVTATEEPGRVTPLWIETEKAGGVLAPWQRDWARQRGAERLASEQDKIDAYFRGEPPPDTLAQARRKWLGGQAGLSEFLAAVDRADLAELNRLPQARRPGPWWRRLLLRVIRYLAGHRRVV